MNRAGADAKRQPIAFTNGRIACGLHHESGAIREASMKIGPGSQVFQDFDISL